MEFVISKDGTRIVYQRSGTGPTLILIHGSAADHNRWAPVLPYLEPHFTVISMDRRGRGQSGDTEPYSVEQEFEDVGAIIEMTGNDTTLLGHSYGGLCATGAALQSPNLKQLILYEPLIPLQPHSRYVPGVLDKLQAQITTGDRDDAVVTFTSEIVGMPQSAIDQLRASPEAWEGRKAAIHTVLRELQVTEGLYYFDTEYLKNLTVPTLLLTGSESPAPLREGVDTLSSLLPHCHVNILEGQQHIAMNSAPELFARMVRDWDYG
jgi:pimeloyl-ACP methyl ester carboxylesterase